MSASPSTLSGEFITVSSPVPHVVLVELSRAPLNSFTHAFWAEYGRVFDNIALLPDVRAVVLASALPKLFSAGLDFTAMAEMNTFHAEPARRALQTRDFVLLFQRAIGAPERCPYPVIAAVHGAAIGLSIDIVAACDIRYAAADASFSIKEVDIGLAADIGTLARLPKLVGNLSLLHELAYTTRAFPAAEAHELGLVSRVVPGSRAEVLAAALATAAVIASKSPIAVLGTKHLLIHARDHTVHENLEYTALWNSAMLQTSDVDNAVKASKGKSKPSFLPLGKPYKL